MLKALSCVDIVRPYHELEYVSGCRGLDADIFVIGADWGAKPHNIVVETYLRANGKNHSNFLQPKDLLNQDKGNRYCPI